LHPRLFQFGAVTFPTYGVFAAIALIAGLMLAVRTAARLRVSPKQVWNLGVAAVFAAAIGSRLPLLFDGWHDFLHYPILLLSVTAPRTVSSYLIQLCLGIFVAALYATFKRMPWLETMDALAPAWALGQGILMLGCFLAGCDYGRPTTVPWAVTFHSPWALLWNQTPLGIPLHPVQLYLCAVEFALCAGLLWWLPRRRQPGELAGAWLLISGLAEYFLDFYRVGNRLPVLGGAVSLTQTVDFVMVIVGALILFERRRPERAPA
jgi:phosphatidylglycerol:prolipoprotein diacylglycerol transferase